MRCFYLLLAVCLAGCAAIEESTLRSTSTICGVHDRAMRVQEVQLIPGSSVYDTELREAMARSFPFHGRAHFAEDHSKIVGSRVNLMVCPECTAAYDAWVETKKKEPNQPPEPSRL